MIYWFSGARYNSFGLYYLDMIDADILNMIDDD